jgi:phage terminase large subunit-like protein
MIAPEDRAERERKDYWRALSNEEFDTLLAGLDPCQRTMLLYHWRLHARAEQLTPAGSWRLWLIMAGRGFGKSRAGAEWVRQVASTDPTARIALVGANLPEVRSMMVEGDNGLLACCPPHWPMPQFEPSLRRISFPNGAQAYLYSAGEPDSLRGPQHSHAWCDEIGKWDNSAERAIMAWDNLQLGLRLGVNPQVVATTTPRAVPLVRRLVNQAGKAGGVLTRGRTQDNARNLPASYLLNIIEQYGGTTLGRQEMDGELLAEVEGALWSRALIDRQRIAVAAEPIVRVVVAVDPPASARGDACGIVVAGVTESKRGLVLADASVPQPSPERWARAVAEAVAHWKADRVVAEANQGGDMVASVLRAADFHMPVQLVHASRSKAARAEPVAALYEANKVHHVGHFPQLEDQLCGILAGGTYEGPGRSPDRADALVWAMHELLLQKKQGPRITQM